MMQKQNTQAEQLFNFSVQMTVTGQDEKSASTHLNEELNRIAFYDKLIVSCSTPMSDNDILSVHTVPTLKDFLKSLSEDIRELRRGASNVGIDNDLAVVDTALLEAVYSRVLAVSYL